MYSGKTISLKTILWKVLGNPLATDLTYEQAAEWAAEAIPLLGSPLVFDDIVSDPLIKVVNYKAAMPSNLIAIRGVRLITDTDNFENNSIALRYATDIYHSGINCSTDSEGNIVEYTYSVQSGVIFTSFEEGYIQIAYQGLGVDKDGYPLIPDESKTKLALEYYILHRFLEPLWMVGKITDKAFSYIEQKRHFYMGSASTSMKLQGIDHAESIMNTINRLIINTKAHGDFYKGSGMKERFKKY